MLLPALLRPLTAVVVLLLAAPADADARASVVLHTALERSEPEKDSRLSAPPTRVSLWFTGKPQLGFTRIRLVSAAGEISLDSIVSGPANSLHARIPRVLTPGTYTVAWQTASADGHPIKGDFAFTVVSDAATAASPGDSAGGGPGSAASHAAHGQPVVHTEYRSARWMEFVALLTVLGALGFRHGVLPPLASRGVPTAETADRARQFGLNALILYAIAAFVRLYSESAAMGASTDVLDADALVPILTSTTWGIGWLSGVVGMLLLIAAWTVFRRRTGVGTPLALTGALGMVSSPALAGHAAASDSFIVSVTLDMVHVAAAGVWLGGLLMVLIAGIPVMRRLTDGNPDAAVSALVNSFHPVALFCAPIVVVAGAGTAWLRVGDLPSLTGTQYGRTLMVKLAFFTLVAFAGAYNSTRGRRQLGTPAATGAVRRTAALELLLASLVLAATTFLVTAPVPTDMAR